jgi:hypothetical protein
LFVFDGECDLVVFAGSAIDHNVLVAVALCKYVLKVREGGERGN